MFAILPILKLMAPIAAGVIGDILGKQERGEITQAEADANIATAMADAEKEIVARQSEVVTAETKSEDWLTRNWRPLVALTSFFSYWYVIVAYPHLVAWKWISADIGFGEVGLENLFWLTATCVGGYIGGRSIEKIAKGIARR